MAVQKRISAGRSRSKRDVGDPLDDPAFWVVYSRILELWNEAASADSGVVKPSAHALRTTLKLLTAAYSEVSGTFPRASACTTDEGGIYIYWRQTPRKVQLIVPEGENDAPSLYHQEGDDYAIVQNIAHSELAHWLNWSING